jgi:hypothetical protein
LVREIAHDPALRGKVIPLAFHVDYWDHLGWRDAFSSPDWSRRQMFYARALHLQGAYTPQMIVNGTRQFVGSSREAYLHTIGEESQRKPNGTIALTAKRNGDALDATVTATISGKEEVWLAIVQKDAVTSVAAGENAGLSIDNAAIVRKLIRVEPQKTVSIPIDKSWGAVTAVAFVQERGTMAIRCATIAP